MEENKVVQNTTPEAKPATDKPAFIKKDEKKFDRNKRQGGKPRFQKRDDGIEEKVVAINRVVKTTKGGRTFRFAALVLVGDKKGRIGFGTGKAKEVPEAIKKGIKDARRNMFRVKVVKGTVPHEITTKVDAGRVMLKPAKSGTGIIAGGPVRSVMELVGITDIYSKSLGSNNAMQIVRATLEGLRQQRTKEDVARLRSATPMARPSFNKKPGFKKDFSKSGPRPAFKKPAFKKPTTSGGTK